MSLSVSEHTVLEASRAVAASLNPVSSSADRAAANQALIHLKGSDTPALLQLAPQLTTSDKPVEVQHYGVQLLQHLATVRWRRMHTLERDQLTELAFKLVGQACATAYEWPVRSKAAMLLATVAKQSQPSFWEQLLQELLKLEDQGAVQAHMACLVIRGVAEEVTQYGDDLNAAAKRALLHALLGSLTTVLPFLHRVLESHFGAASQAMSAGQMQDAQAHAAVVAAALDSLKEHMEWAPVDTIVAARMMEALGVLMTVQNFRLAAGICVRMLSARKQGREDAETFKTAMATLSSVLMTAASAALSADAKAAASANSETEDYVTVLCEALTSYGVLHLNCLPSEAAHSTFLHQMLGMTGHSNLRVAALILPFWTSVFSSPDSPRTKAAPAVPPPALPAEIPGRLSALAGDWLRKGPSILRNVPDDFADAADWQGFIQDFRSQLGNIMRQISRLMPEAGLTAALARLPAAAESAHQAPSNPSEAQIIQFEAAVSFLEYVVPPIADAQLKAGLAHGSVAVVGALEQLLQQLLMIKVTDASRALALARALESFASLTALRPQLATHVIQKVFDMLACTPLGNEPLGAAPPGRLAPGWKDRFAARQRITNLFLEHAKGAPQAIIPHRQAICARMDQLRQQGTVWASDVNIICDGLLAAAAQSTPDIQSQVVGWVLAPVSAAWSSPDWQQRLASSDSFLACYAPLQTAPDGTVQVGGGQARWELFHHVHLLERAAKRLKPSVALAGAASVPQADPGWHALNSQLHWAVPVLLQLVTLLHSLWTPQERAKIQPAAAALGMSARERGVHLRMPTAELPEEDDTTLGSSLVASLRSFLRHVRELVYQALGLIASQVYGFMSCAQFGSQWSAAFVGQLVHLTPQHLRGLVRHVLNPIIRFCPPAHRAAWLLPVLGPMLHFNLQQLNAAWGRLSAGRDAGERESAAAASEEVVQERLLRELTSEHVTMLCHLHSQAAGSTPFLWMVANAPEAAYTAALTATAALWWPHGDALSKGAAFCKGVVGQAPRLRSPMRELVCRDMLRGCIAGLPSSSGAVQSELLGLARDILSLRQPLSRQVLQSLPRATDQVLEDFEQAFEAAAAERDSRNAVKVLVRDAGAEEHSAGLSSWKPLVPVSNVSSRNAQLAKKQDHGTSDDHNGPLGISALAEGAPG